MIRLLPYIICAFNAIDRDCDEVVSDQVGGIDSRLGLEELDAWIKDPKLEQRTEDSVP